MQQYNIIKLFLLCGILAIWASAAFAGQSVKELTLKNLSHAMESIVNDVGGIYRDGDKVIVLPDRGSSFLTVNYDDKQRGISEAFTVLKDGSWDSMRTTFPPTVGEGYLRGVLPFVKDTLLILDGKNTRMVVWDVKNHNFLAEHSIIMDLLTPARDSRGEATRPETTALRARFAAAFKALIDRNAARDIQHEIDVDRLAGVKAGSMIPVKANPLLHIVGMAPVAKQNSHQDAPEFLVLSQIEGFSLLEMSCDHDNIGNCSIKQVCNLENRQKLTAAGMIALGTSTAHQLVLIADKINHEIAVFRYDSCYNVHRTGTILLPLAIYDVSSLYLDKDDNLWVGTRWMDNYYNAALYVWKPEQWLSPKF